MEKSLIFKGKITELEELSKILEFETLPVSFKENWENAIKTYPNETPFFLQDEFIDITLNKVSVLSELKEEFKKAAQLARDDERILRVAWLWYHMCYIQYDWRGIYSWPNLCSILGEHGNIIPMLVLLTGYDSMIEFYSNREIPNEVEKTTHNAIKSSFTRFANNYNRPGSGNDVLAWVIRYFAGRLYYLGRLQYELQNCHNNILVYRNYNTNEVVCLAEDNQTFRKDGKYDGNNGIYDYNNTWISEYEESEEFINGHPISPMSYAIQKKIRLKKSEWELVLQREDPVISIHIPGGTKLDSSDVKSSLLEAEVFFSTYFPSYKWRSFICNSWLLDTQLREFLKQDSNIIKFQDYFYLFPIDSSSDTSVYKFLFNTKKCSPEEVKAKSSLQKNVKNYLLKGGKITGGGGFILREDIGLKLGNYKANFRYP
ncbi:MAG: hypothetical protein PHV53_11875 [Fermentimonas sp.]|nr:hypothetical protein [Fermentimonas sp.]